MISVYVSHKKYHRLFIRKVSGCYFPIANIFRMQKIITSQTKNELKFHYLNISYVNLRQDICLLERKTSNDGACTYKFPLHSVL